jgi:hypothetical protein
MQARQCRFRKDVIAAHAALTIPSRIHRNQLTLPPKLSPLKALCEDRLA